MPTDIRSKNLQVDEVLAASQNLVIGVSSPAEARLRCGLLRWEQSINGGAWGPLSGVQITTIPRPWGAGVSQELRADPVTGTVYLWNVTLNRWVSVSPNDIAFTLYVNGITGNDAAAGDIANPVKTVMEAVHRLPQRIVHDVVIDIADNAGAVLLYDEQVIIEDIAVEGDATFLFQGKSVARVAIAAAPANSGTYRTWTISPSPGWVANAYVGMCVEFTAGDHAGVTAWILGNTADTLTLGYYPWPWENAYGPTDAGEIREVTTQIRYQTAPAGPYTMCLRNLSSSLPTSGRRFKFDLIHLRGDSVNDFTVNAAGQNTIQFTRCRIDDYFGLDVGSGGFLSFSECLAWTCRNAFRLRWFSNYPGSDTTVVYVGGGVIGGFVMGVNNGHNCHLSGVNVVTDPITPTNSPNSLLLLGGRHLEFTNGSINGAGIRTPMYVVTGSYGTLSIYTAEVYGSNTSGIRFEPEGLAGLAIDLDNLYDPVWQPVSNFHNNAQYGIDLLGTGRITFFGPTLGPANGVGGMRMRDGAFALFVGPIGSEPLLVGPAPGTDINFDDRTPTLWLPFTTDQTGLETLCRYSYRGV